MQEVELSIMDTQKGDKVYSNITLKRNKQSMEQGVKTLAEEGDFVILKKVYAKGYETVKNEGADNQYSFFNCKVVYKEKEVSFLLYERDHKLFEEICGMDEEFKIILHKKTIMDKSGTEKIIPELEFAKAE